MGRARDAQSAPWSPGDPSPIRLRELFANPEGRSGRLDAFSRVGLAAVTLALRDSGRTESADKKLKKPVALVAWSARGCLATDAEYYRTVIPQGGKFASPNLFAYTLPTCFLGEAAIRFGLTGPTLVLSGGCDLGALETGLDLIASGDAEAAVCGICDLPAPPGIPLPEGFASGAVFAVVEPVSSLLTPLAEIERSPEGGLRLSGERCSENFIELFSRLLGRGVTENRI
jgi:3-oxoacyl-[acyl-carrier-protein] synthase II